MTKKTYKQWKIINITLGSIYKMCLLVMKGASQNKNQLKPLYSLHF